MKIDRIGYHKNYNIVGMQWEKIIMEGELEPGDNEMECIKELRRRCDSAAQSHEPQYTLPDNFNDTHTSRMEGNTLVVEPKLSKEESMIKLIGSCNSLAELKSYELISKNNESFKEAYANKLKELTQ